MNDRSYLSIGDVLALLREEFPDITISKIRFLESRGLLVPERTPSGYRKFYDHDVERLRWILRQQRENFLPLKVIKGRLEGQAPSSEPAALFEVSRDEGHGRVAAEPPQMPSEPSQPLAEVASLSEKAALSELSQAAPESRQQLSAQNGSVGESVERSMPQNGAVAETGSLPSARVSPVGVTAAAQVPYGAHVGAVGIIPRPQGSVTPASGAQTSATRHHAEAPATSGVLQSHQHGQGASGSPGRTGGSPTGSAGGSEETPHVPPPSARGEVLRTPGNTPAPATPAPATPAAATPAAATPALGETRSVATAATTPAEPARPVSSSGPLQSETRAEVPSEAAATGTDNSPTSGGSSSAAATEEPAKTPSESRTHSPDVSSLSGASLTAQELAQATGLTVAEVEELESFGLIESKNVAGVACYDESALLIAGLAAGFAKFGVEARHLRMYKHAAERQVSLYSQIVIPLLRQRNPDARRRAHDQLVRLTELGASLQACFAKAALRDLTGG